MLMSFDINFIRSNKKTLRNGEAAGQCKLSEPFRIFWSSLINLIYIKKLHGILFIMQYFQTLIKLSELMLET